MVGFPKTSNAKYPPEIALDPISTLMKKEFSMIDEVVKNVNDTPPSLELGIILLALVVETVKSLGMPVVAPETPETRIVHETDRIIRAGFGTTQTSDDAVVGLP